MKYIYVENGVLNGCGYAQQLGDNVLNIEVNDDIYETFIDDNLKFIYKNGQIVENPDYDLDNRKRTAQNRIYEIETELEELDKKRIRAVCEDELKDSKTGETWLDYYNAQIYDLRVELKSLKALF